MLARAQATLPELDPAGWTESGVLTPETWTRLRARAILKRKLLQPPHV